MKKKLIYNGIIVNENRRFEGYIIIEGTRIKEVKEGKFTGKKETFDSLTDAKGGYIIPGVIDDQVHFREPGLTYKGDIHSESRAAVAGGVTSYMDMPNTKPTTTSWEALNWKYETAEANSLANYSFYLGATNTNFDVIEKADIQKVCGIKVFMGSSTGNMLVDSQEMLVRLFSSSPLLIATHCEEEHIIQENLKRYKALYGDTLTASTHPAIRNSEACYASTAKAVELAHKYGGRLHVLHLSTRRETELFDARPIQAKNVTCEVCVHHLWFSDKDYAEKGNFIKWNPAIKTEADREGLREALKKGRIDVVATDHAPHSLEEKKRPYMEAPSGGPLIQHSLTAMMELVKHGVFTPEMVVEKMAHAPARLFNIRERGFLRPGYFADITVIAPDNPWTVTPENILYKCHWSPFMGQTFSCKVTHTFINGTLVYDNGILNEDFRGMALEFDR